MFGVTFHKRHTLLSRCVDTFGYKKRDKLDLLPFSSLPAFMIPYLAHINLSADKMNKHVYRQRVSFRPLHYSLLTQSPHNCQIA